MQQYTADQLDVAKESEHFEALASRLLDYAKKQGAEQAELGLAKDLGLSVTVRNGDVETLEFNRDNSFAVTVYKGHRKGSVSTSDLSESTLQEAVAAACRIAKHTQPDPCAGLADPEYLAQTFDDLQLDWPAGLTAEQAIDKSRQCEAAGLATDKRISKSEGASLTSHRRLRLYANSHGFCGLQPSTRHSMSCVLIAEDKGGMQRDYWYDVARDINDLSSVELIGREAAKRTVARLGGQRVKTQDCPVLFSPEMARTLLGHFLAAIRGGNLYRKSSFLREQLGQQIFPQWFTLNEDPFVHKGLASRCYDSEGVVTKAQNIVEAGVLQTYLLDSYSARKLNMQPTGHAGGTHNLSLLPTHGYDDILGQIKRGFLVTEMMGQGVNIVTGDFSRGAAGFWIENGEIQHFVEEVTVAGNLRDMFTNMQAIGDDVDRRGATHCGSILVEGMTLAGE